MSETTLAEWIRDHAITSDTLDPGAPLDDLEPVRELIGDAHVVAIGESAHYVREFTLLRHRLLRFLAERCGFRVYAMEAPFTEAHAIDAWVQGGPGTVAEVAARVPFGQADSAGMHDHLSWMRAHNRAADQPLRFAGTTVPGSGGSPLPALEWLASYLRRADPDALPLLEQATELASGYHDPASFAAMGRYATLDDAVQDKLTATLGRLLVRMETTDSHHRAVGHGREHAIALQHLRGVWHLDHFHRDLAGRGIAVEHPHALHDKLMAESVMRLLERGAPDTRVLVASHNIHIQKAPLRHHGAIGLFPHGYHLAEALGDDYVAIAVTSARGGTARMRMKPEHPLGFEVDDLPLPPVVDASIEAAFTTRASLTIADLRNARADVDDADAFQRMRMEDYFKDVPVLQAFDAIACIAETAPDRGTRFHKRDAIVGRAQA